MEHHISGLTHFVNHLLGQYVLMLLSALHIQPNNPKEPIPEHVAMSLVAFAIGVVLVLWLKPRLSVDRPGGAQQIAEMLLTNSLGFGIRDLLDENVGKGGRQFVPMVGSVGVFILLANLLSVFPYFTAPTAVVTVPLGCAIITFLYFNWQGIRHHGLVGYMKHFAGDVWWISPLIFPVEILSTCARVLSLTVRLWANIFASDMLYGVFVSLLVAPVAYGWAKWPLLGIVLGIFPAVIPLAFIGLHIFVSVIQAYVFTILPSIYLGLATAEEH
jgi:F-type H+-transporting ATPase subunit a